MHRNVSKFFPDIIKTGIYDKVTYQKDRPILTSDQIIQINIGTGNYAALLPETLAPLNSPENRCSVVHGVPNGNRQTTEHPLNFRINVLVKAA